MDAKPSKRPIPTGTAIFFIEKDGPSETFTRLANIRKLNKAEAQLIRKEVLQQTEGEKDLYAAAFEAKGYGNERFRAGNRAIGKMLDGNALLEDARIQRTIGHENIVFIAPNGLMETWSFILNKGTTKGLREQTVKAIDLFDDRLEEMAACLDIHLNPQTRPINKQIAGCIHFFRKASEAGDHLAEFMFLICAVDGISGLENVKSRTGKAIGRLVHLYKQHKRPKIKSRLESAFRKRGELFHANTLMDDVTLENEKSHYITEISTLRKIFQDALHAMLIQSKKHDTLDDAWIDFKRRSHAYKDENADSTFITMTSGKRIHADFSPAARELLCSIQANSFNSITRPSRGESP